MNRAPITDAGRARNHRDDAGLVLRPRGAPRQQRNDVGSEAPAEMPPEMPWGAESEENADAAADVHAVPHGLPAFHSLLEMLSGESDIDRLLTAAMRLALETADSHRGVLVVPAGETLRIEAEAERTDGAVRVVLRRTDPGIADWPHTLIQHVVQTRSGVMRHASSGKHDLVSDEYFRRRGSLSILCLPLVKNDTVVGAIYLESKEASGGFSPARLDVLRLLASQTALSLENARLYREVRDREARVRRLVDSNIIGVAMWHADGRILDINDAFLRTIGYSRDDVSSGRLLWNDMTPPEWHVRDAQALLNIKDSGVIQAHEREYFRKDGTRVPVLAAGAVFDGVPDEGVAFALDLSALKEAREAQLASERECRLIVQSIPGMLAMLTASGEVAIANPSLLQYCGQDLENLRQWATNGTIHPDDLARVAEEFGSALASESSYEIVQRIRRWDGTYRWLLNSGYPLRDAFGQVTRWCVLLTDIDDRKRAEDACAASERTLRLTVDTIPALAWSAGPDGTVDFFNRHYLDYLGVARDQALGSGWISAVHPDDRRSLAVAMRQMLTAGVAGESEARLRRRDGEYRWFLFRMNPLRDDDGRIAKWYGVNTDIEDRKRATDDLRRSSEFLLEVQRLTQTVGWRLDLATGRVDTYPGVPNSFAAQPGDDTTGTAFYFSQIHPDDRARVENEFNRCIREREVYRAAYRLMLPDGGVRYQHSTGHPVVSDAGELIEFVGAATDMTEHWQAANELERASESLRDLQTKLSRAAEVATVGELAAAIAHEVNQPLAGIITNAGTCLRMLDTSPPNLDGARETARRTIRDGNRAAEVITRVRALFSKEELTMEPFGLSDAAHEVVALYMTELHQEHVQLRSELAFDLPLVAGDRVQVQQVILNLLRNAADAMSGIVSRPRRLVVTTMRAAGNQVQLRVVDSGVGVERHGAEKLFDAFYTTKEGGMGVGLSVSRSIVERHHGRLWAEPNDGPGATFTLSLPCIGCD